MRGIATTYGDGCAGLEHCIAYSQMLCANAPYRIVGLSVRALCALQRTRPLAARGIFLFTYLQSTCVPIFTCTGLFKV